MKSIPVREAQSQLRQLIAEACRGEVIVLTDGDKQVTLVVAPLDLEVDTPELEAELLKAANGPFTPLREGELSSGKSRTGRCANTMPNGMDEALPGTFRAVHVRLRSTVPLVFGACRREGC